MTNQQQKFLYFLAAALLLGALAVFVRPEAVWGFLALVVAVIILVQRPAWGIYAMAALHPFIYWQIFFGGDLNVPYVDVVALLLFVAWVIKVVVEYLRGGQPLTAKNFPGFGLFVLFFIAGALSLINAPDWLAGLKYLLRPLSFFYLMFVLLPFNLIRDLKILKNTLWILYGVGMVAALMGLWSLIFPASHELLRRALPPLFNGFNPLGSSHNVLAEVLVSIIPLGWLLFETDGPGRRQRWLFLGLILMIVINLMTFSRAGWLALALEAVMLAVFYYRRHWRKIVGVLAAVVVLLWPLWLLVGQFLSSPTVQSSNTNRWQLTEIAWQSFKAHPLIGAGAGTFIQQVAQDEWYLLDFGSPLEAHGVVQKLMAEMGILGLLTFAALLGYCFWYLWRTYRHLPPQSNWRLVILCLGMSAAGSAFFQLFNTSYFISKMWLPIGVAMAGCQLARLAHRREFK